MILDKIESAGIRLDTDGEYIDITGKITDEQRTYLMAHKQHLIVALRLRPIAERHGHDLGDLLDWYKDDISDLYAMPDTNLETVVEDYIRLHGMYRHCKPVPFYVRCIDCAHFTRSDHPHLGRCGAGVQPTAACGMFWDTDARGCKTYTASRPADDGGNKRVKP